MAQDERPRITKEALEQASSLIKEWDKDQNKFERIPPDKLNELMQTVSRVIQEQEFSQLDPETLKKGMNAIAEVVKDSRDQHVRIEKEKLHFAFSKASELFKSKAFGILEKRLASQKSQKSRGG